MNGQNLLTNLGESLTIAKIDEPRDGDELEENVLRNSIELIYIARLFALSSEDEKQRILHELRNQMEEGEFRQIKKQLMFFTEREIKHFEKEIERKFKLYSKEEIEIIKRTLIKKKKSLNKVLEIITNNRLEMINNNRKVQENDNELFEELERWYALIKWGISIREIKLRIRVEIQKIVFILSKINQINYNST